MKNIKIVNIKTSFKDFFRKWLIITKPFNKMTSLQIEIIAIFLFNFYKYKKEINNDKLAWRIVFDYDTKQSIRDELNLSVASFNNILSKLRKDGVIIDNEISSLYIPILSNNTSEFNLTFVFKINED